MRKQAILAAALVATATLVPAATAVSKPGLVLVTKRPFVVKGERFRAGERVTLTAMTAIGPRVVRVNAGPSGGFKVAFRLPNQPCSAPFVVRARGATAVATMKVALGLRCTPPPVD